MLGDNVTQRLMAPGKSVMLKWSLCAVQVPVRRLFGSVQNTG
jgi:hypothetical protein